MTFIIHKDDLAVLREIADGEYLDDDDWLKALWQAVCARLELRDGWLVVIYYPWGSRAYGTHSSRPRAIKRMNGYLAALGPGVHGNVVPYTSGEKLEPVDLKPRVRLCPLCGHPATLHAFPGVGGGCISGIVTKPRGRPDKSSMCGCKHAW